MCCVGSASHTFFVSWNRIRFLLGCKKKFQYFISVIAINKYLRLISHVLCLIFIRAPPPRSLSAPSLSLSFSAQFSNFPLDLCKYLHPKEMINQMEKVPARWHRITFYIWIIDGHAIVFISGVDNGIAQIQCPLDWIESYIKKHFRFRHQTTLPVCFRIELN